MSKSHSLSRPTCPPGRPQCKCEMGVINCTHWQWSNTTKCWHSPHDNKSPNPKTHSSTPAHELPTFHSRDYTTRLNALLAKFPPTEQQHKLVKAIKKLNTNTVLHYLETLRTTHCNPTPNQSNTQENTLFISTEQHLITTQLLNLRLTNLLPHKSKASKPTFINIPYLHPILADIQLNKYLTQSQFTSLIPNHTQLTPYMPTPSLVFNSDAPFWLNACNYHKPQHTANNTSCSCHKYPDHIEPHYKHVMTTDTTIIANEQLRELFDYGRGLRLYPEILSNDPEALIDTLTVAIHTYCHQTAQRLSLADEYFAAWEVTVTKHLANTVKTLLANYKPPPTTPTLPPELKAALILLQEDFIISYVDKSSNDYAFFLQTALQQPHHHRAQFRNLHRTSRNPRTNHRTPPPTPTRPRLHPKHGE